MKTLNTHPEDFDAKARELASKIPVGSSEQGWNSLEKELDLLLPTGNERRQKKWIESFLHILLSSTFFLFTLVSLVGGNDNGKPSGQGPATDKINLPVSPEENNEPEKEIAPLEKPQTIPLENKHQPIRKRTDIQHVDTLLKTPPKVEDSVFLFW